VLVYAIIINAIQEIMLELFPISSGINNLGLVNMKNVALKNVF
jgi:hypothetical protein